MTQPVPVSVDGTDTSVAQLNDLQAALAGVTVGVGAMDVELRRAQQTTQRGTFGSRGLADARDYQQSLSGIAATAAATRQSLSGLRGDVESLARSMPGGTQLAIQTVQATQQLGLSQRSQINQIRQLSGEFTKLGAATGSFAPAIATQFGTLNRELANLDPSRLSRFSDVVTTLQAKTGASAGGMLSFAQSISPVAQQAGLGESAILGTAAAFVKLGDDGGAAATAVNKILGDLNSSVRTGSSQMVAYANATGMTVKQFDALFRANPAAALEKVTSQLGQPTSQSTYLLQTLGLDSVRTQRAFSELGQSGGLRQTINTAVGAYGSGSTDRAAAAALGGVNDKMQQLHTTAHQLGTALEGPLLRPLGKFLGIVQAVASPLASVVSHVAGSRIGGDALATLGTTAFLGMGGAHLLFGAGKRMLGPAWAATLGTSGPVMGGLAGFRSGMLGPDAAGMNEAGLLGFVGRRQNAMLAAGLDPAAQMGRRSMSGINRGAFNFFQGLGEQFHDPNRPLTPRASLINRLISGGATAASLANQGYWRLLQQPLVQARQSPLDREFTLTTPGGPGRSLLSGLHGAWSNRDMGAATQALGDFTKSVGGGGVAVKRFAGTMWEAGGNILKLGASAAGGAASAGLGAAGDLIKDHLPVIGGIVAIGAYEMYRSSRNNAQNETAGADPSLMYATLNKYRDSMGEAGVAAVNLAQQMNDAAANLANNVTKYSQAGRLGAADVHAFGLTNKDKTINRMTGTAQQVASQIVALHAGQRMTPSDMQAIKHDLYNQGYNGPQIDRILSLVPHGMITEGAADIATTIAHASFQAGRGHRGDLGNTWSDITHPLGWLGGAGIGETGGGSPIITGTGRQLLNQMALGIKATANTNASLGGGRYATGVEVKQANQAMADALKTHNESLIVATEQTLTRTLTGHAVKGMGVVDIEAMIANHPDALGPLGAILQGHGAKVNGLRISTGLLSSAAQQQTSDAVNALAGQGNSLLAQFFTGHTGSVQRAINSPGDPRANQQAASEMVSSMTKAGDSLTKIAAVVQRNLNVTGPQGNIIAAAYAQTQQRLAFSQISMTPAQALGTSIRSDLIAGRQLPPHASDQQKQIQSNAISTGLPSDYQALTAGLNQRLQAQFNYEIQSRRSNYDFNLQMSRSEQDFHIQDLRSQQDYYRQKLYATQDYNLSVKRAIEDAATSEYDIYQRIQTQPVFGATDLLMNVKEQDQAIQQQHLNLNRVRNLGLSGMAVQTLGLAQTANAQQLQQLVDDFAANPQLVQQMNREVGKRLKGAGALYKDPGDTTYNRQLQDFTRQMARGKSAFDLQQSRLADDFQRQSERAVTDHEKMMSRMAQDLHNQDLAITSDMKAMQTATQDILHGQAVDWKNLMVQNFKELLRESRHYAPLIQQSVQLGWTAPGAFGGGGSSGGGAAPPGGGIGGIPAGKDQPSHLYRASSKAGMNEGYLFTPNSRPGQDTNTYGNTPMTWGRNVSRAPSDKNLVANARLAKQMAAGHGWTGVEWDALYQIWQQESGFSTSAGNVSAAYGIPQSDPGNKMATYGKDWMTNPKTQIAWGLGHIASNYGDPLGAWAHKVRTGWYAGGGIATAPHMGVVAEGGNPEAMIPLNQHGVTYLAQAISKYISSADAANIISGGRGNSITINANHYTQSYGHTIEHVEVRANSLQEIWDAMDKKERMDNLTGPRGVRKGPSS